MSILDFFKKAKKVDESAVLAKDRLQIIIAERRVQGCGINNIRIDDLRKDIVHTITKHIFINDDMVDIKIEYEDNDISVMELNIRIPN